MTKPLTANHQTYSNKGWMYLFLRCCFHIQKNLWCEDFSIVSFLSSTFCCFFIGSQAPPNWTWENKRTCHNSCHNLLSISIEINFCTHNSQAPNQAIPFYHLDVSGEKIFYYIFHPFQIRRDSKLHRNLFFVLGEGWKIFS